ncbi:hypothetical protein [Amycolatopsis sp. NPDC051071]|uniref:hypothetical protein n=1 Tax=Amycolatopsis sp. NPDC051071 TaxID=3154637 RepID=UPI00341DBA88
MAARLAMSAGEAAVALGARGGTGVEGVGVAALSELQAPKPSPIAEARAVRASRVLRQ